MEVKVPPLEPPVPPAAPLARRGYLGFEVLATPGLDRLNERARKSIAQEQATNNLERERWIVSDIAPASPAELAGLSRGDDVCFLDGAPLTSLAELRQRAGAVRPGERCELGVLRAGELVTLELVSHAMPTEQLSAGTVELDSVAWCHAGERHQLRVIWTLPHGTAPKAVVWLLPSAAWISQECPLDPEDPTLQLIDHLTIRGLATLRVDRSGLGDSQGPHPSELDFAAELAMWQAAREYVFASPWRERVGLFGRSLGGIFAPLVAADHPFGKVAVWGTSGEDWHAASLRSFAHQRRLAGMAEPELRRTLVDVELLQHLVYVEGITPEQARTRFPHLRAVLPEAFAGNLVHDRTARFFSQLQRAEVAAHWNRVQADVLAVHAEYDVLVPEEDLRRLAELAGERARFLSLLGVDHFLHARGSLAEAVERPWGGTFSLEAARVLGDFFEGQATDASTRN